MKIGMMLQRAETFTQTADELADFEDMGLDLVAVPEAYGFDAVSQLGYLAARTKRLTLLSSILPIFGRSPSLTAMTAAGLDHVSDGRFSLGIGASGPGVVSGFHGIPFDAPLGRTREIIEICRLIWTRAPLEYQGRYYRMPGPLPRRGEPLLPIKLADRPVRRQIPVSLAAIGPRNVTLAAEVADGWLPIFFNPSRATEIWGAALAEGYARRNPALGQLKVLVQTTAGIGPAEAAALDAMRTQLAFYVGAMGPPGQNFYNDLAVSYGYAEEAAEIQRRHLNGDRAGAAQAVPEALIREVSLIGSPVDVAKRIATFAEAGVHCLIVRPAGKDHSARRDQIETLRQLADNMETTS